jgi:hypothetical protein
VNDRTKVVIQFAGAFSLIVTTTLVLAFVYRVNAQVVAPIGAIAMAVNVFVFASRFNAARKRQPLPNQMDFTAPNPVSGTAGAKFLRVVMILTLLVAFAMAITLVVEARDGTLESDDIIRFVPRIALIVALTIYVFRKTGKSLPR